MTLIFSLTFLLAFAQAQTGTITLANCPNASADQVISPPTLNSPLATLVANQYTVNWLWQLTQTRTQTPSYQFGSCSAVTPPTTSAASGDCTLNQSASVNWSTLTSSCGWTGTSNEGILSYTGSIVLSGTETFTDSREVTQTRTLTYEFQLEVDFPENTTVSTNITSTAPVLVDEFITKQTYDRVTNHGLVSFTTQVQYPWAINLTHDVSSSNVNTAVVDPDPVDPGTIATSLGGVSSQNWVLTITPDTSVCVLDGTYTIQAQLICTLANQSDCPALSSPSTYPMALAVTSQNFCAQTSINVPIVGTLTVFSDANFATPKTNFELRTLSYYRLNISSPAASITTIDIDQIKVSSDSPVVLDAGTASNSTLIYDSAAWSPVTAPNNLSSPTSNGGVQTFSFNSTAELLSIPRDSAVNVTISARASISFLGNSKKKRATFTLLQLSTQTKTYGANVQYSDTQVGAPTSSASFTGPCCLILLGWFFALVSGSF